MEATIDASFEPDTTYKRILNVIQVASQPSGNNSTGLFEEFACGGSSTANNLDSEISQKQRADGCRPSGNEMICRMLLDAVKDPRGHIKRLDDATKRYTKLKITFSLLQESDLAHRVDDVLERLPQNARLYREENDERIGSSMDYTFFVQGADKRTPNNLRVMKFLPTAVLQLAVLVTLPVPCRQDWHGQATRDFVNMVAECLEIALGLEPETSFSAGQLCVVRSYLWNLWHRSLTLHRYYILKLHLTFGFTYPVHQTLSTRGLSIEDIVRKQCQKCEEMTGTDSKIPKQININALDLLRADPSAVGIDYEPLYHHIRRVMVSRSPNHPNLHAPHCAGSCSYVTRKEIDTQSPTEPVAVALLPAHETVLQYCKVSARTMVISALWAQTEEDDASSRARYPACWHESFCALARNSSCNSYWTEIMCLPIDKTARRCALESVNSIFEESKLTVICDRSIMTLDEREDKEGDYSYMEDILAAMLVSNWNLEAWSLVAAMKGAQALHVLCKDDLLLPVHDIIQAVHHRGSIELANLSLFLYHILRPSTSWVLSSMKTVFWSDNATGIYVHRDTRTVAVEEAGRLLDYRRTYRETDYIHIWCLLTGVPLVDTASEFWWCVSKIQTGYIFSTMPRIVGTTDFTWAPNGPGIWNGTKRTPFHTRQWSARHYQQSEIAENISRSGNHLKGLRGIWNFCSLEHFDLTKEVAPLLGHAWGFADELMKSRNDRGLIKTIRSFKSGMSPIPTNDTEWHAENKMTLHVNKMSSAWHLFQLPTASRKELSRLLKQYTPDRGHLALIYPCLCDWGWEDCNGSSNGVGTDTLAVVFSDLGDKYDAKWRWFGTIQWDKSVQLPTFQKRRITLM